MAKATRFQTVHGMSRTKFHSVWRSMKARCLNTEHRQYQNYGGRGVTVCDRWMSFENFYEDMFGSYREGLQIDRIDNDKGYSKANCRWTDRRTNLMNRKNTRKIYWEGRLQNLRDVIAWHGLDIGTYDGRIKRGWSEFMAITEPVNKNFIPKKVRNA